MIWLHSPALPLSSSHTCTMHAQHMHTPYTIARAIAYMDAPCTRHTCIRNTCMHHAQVEEVLLLWDRVVGLDSLLPVALLAAAVVCFRRQVCGQNVQLCMMYFVCYDMQHASNETWAAPSARCPHFTIGFDYCPVVSCHRKLQLLIAVRSAQQGCGCVTVCPLQP